jgi:hypothetical protein
LKESKERKEKKKIANIIKRREKKIKERKRQVM